MLSSKAPPMTLRAGGDTIHSRYRIQRCIGQGAMGAVYLVDDLELPGAQWALKELDIGIVLAKEREMARELFLRESEILARLRHPGLPRVIDYFDEEGGSRCLVMTFVEGQPLDEVLSSIRRPLLPQEAFPIALQLCDILDYLHRSDPVVVFRDLKPSNIMLTPQGKICLIDFGIARNFDPEKKKDTQELGTPGFCAPEQYGHSQSAPRSDIYALGTTLFFLLSTEDPQSYNFKFPEISSLVQVPESLDEVLQKMLALKPNDRYQSIEEVRPRLEEVAGELSPLAPGATRTLFPGLLVLLGHGREPCRPELLGGWPFWKEWIRRTFVG